MSRSHELVGSSARIVDEAFPQRSFTGFVVYDASHTYDGYRALVNFIAASGTMRLVYAPRYETDTGEFLADTEIEQLS